MLTILLTYTFVAFLAIIIFYLFGGIIFKAIKLKIANDILKFFAYLLVGMFAAVIIYSIFITHGNTIMTGLLIPFLFILFSIKKMEQNKESLLEYLKINPKFLLLSALILLAVCGYHLFFLWDTTNHYLLPAEADKIFYVRAADYLNNFKIETSYLDYFNANSPNPYHYFELWLIAMINSSNALNTLLVQQLCVNSIFFLVLYFGALAIVSFFKKITAWDVLICLLLPFFQGLKIPIFPALLYHQHDYYFFENMICVQKLFPFSILFIAAGILFIKKRMDIALLLLLATSFLNISFIISIPIAIIGFSLVIRPNNWMKIIIATVLTLVFSMVFYSLNRTTEMMTESPTLSFMIRDTFSSFMAFKTAFNICAKSCIEIILLFFPFLFVFIFLYRKESAFKASILPLTLFVMMEYFIAAAVWAVFNVKSDSQQLFYRVGIPMVSVYIFILAIFFLSKMRGIKLIITYIALLLWGSVSVIATSEKFMEDKAKIADHYAPEYLNSVKEKLMNLNNLGGHLTTMVGDYDIFMLKFMVYSYKPYLATIKNNISITLLQTTDSIRLSDDSLYCIQEKQIEKIQTFNRYMEKKKALPGFVSEMQSRMDFIHENKLQFIIADKNAAIDSLLLTAIDTTLTDKKSGERFIVLKKFGN